ncbi:thymidylate synthase [Methanosarcina sp. MSH10X1]|uniref:DUF166 domain-containing protein n=1 Tax=Methanosarcina sp. MSH10X1 TaxID=2507075 RepID=UPI000FFBDE80|nr:DUF166 domain-containing protein [Methanosarcina sp. MSH10X1]RXA20215.1 thymidylate synthase [Methanosarcina sp. MSH10X1]
MKILVLYSGELGRKVIQNLINPGNFCVSCGELCNHCRQVRKSYANLIVGIHEFPEDLPTFIEEPDQYMPQKLPECDLILAIGIHPDLLMALPGVVKKTKAKAVIAPAEDSKKTPAGVLEQLRKELEAIGVEFEGPRPFCALEKTGKPVIDAFVDLGFGRPVLRIEMSPDGKMFIGAGVLRDAPCGSTWFVAKKLGWTDISDYKETISGAHHSYPCIASMDKDPQLGDTILHKAGYTIREAAEDAMECEKREKSRISVSSGNEASSSGL